jgi:hypothetical protein
VLTVSGGGAVARAAGRLESAARGGLKRDLERAMGRGTRNVEEYFRVNARDRMPKRGGFAAEYAKAKIKSSRIAYGVRLTVVSPHDAARIERGRLRHPRFGHTGPGDWSDTRVPPDVVRDAVVRADAEITREVNAALHRVMGERS